MTMLLMDRNRATTGLAERVTRVAFILYVVYRLVGVTQPFRDTDLAANNDPNPINRIVDTVIPFISVLCLWPKRSTVLTLIRREKFLTLLIFWCLASTLWADFPFISLKAAVRLIGSTIVVLAFFLNAKTTTDALKQIKQILKIYIPLSFLAILLVPAATQWEWPAWRGLTTHKNTLGQISFISAVVLAYGIRELTAKKRLVAGGFLLSAVVLVLGSKSTTCLIALMSVCLMSTWLFVDRRAGRLVALALLVCLLSLTALGGILDLDKIFGAFGKDTTFTDRTDLWPVIIDEAKSHPILGCGFNGFWVVDNPSVLGLYAWDQFPWKPTEAHEGYVDLFNEIGAVGVLLLALMILTYFKSLMKLRKPLYWKWFFIGILIVNFTESTLFRPSDFLSWMFVMSYLALYVELIRQESYARGHVAAAA